MLKISLRLLVFLAIATGTRAFGEQSRVRVLVSDALGNSVTPRRIDLSCGQYMVIAMSPKGCSGMKIATARVLAERFEMKIDTARVADCRPAKE